MNDIIVTTKRNVFPLTSYYLILGDKKYKIRPRDVKKVKLCMQGTYEVVASTYWINKKVKLFLKDQSVLWIRHIIPDAYYLFGTLIVIILSILSFLGLVNLLMLSGGVLLYFLPLIYYTFLEAKNYLKIETEETT